ncbi:MAG TPA: hypothetical protein VHG71_01955 [Verrucomicrobiae bacterium]|nr:hypothetical protein [Verrucomicrobiae bacterium]
MKWIFKWLLRLFILAVVLIVIFLLSYNSILRVLIEHNIRKQTGMDAEIGRFHLGLVEPTIEIQNLKIFNPPDFGGTLFLDIPEIHVEYDRDALAHREIHLTLLRLNLGELNIVKNSLGRTNIFALGVQLPSKKHGIKTESNLKKETGLDFKQIDVLNVSVGTTKYIDLQNPKNDRAQNIGIENCIMKNVKSENDLAGLMVLVVLRGGDFFGSLVLPQKN